MRFTCRDDHHYARSSLENISLCAAGVSIGYDLGRRESDDLGHLHGLGTIAPAPIFKVFGSYVISKDFPLVMRVDIRQIVGGADGLRDVKVRATGLRPASACGPGLELLAYDMSGLECRLPIENLVEPATLTAKRGSGTPTHLPRQFTE